MPQTVYTYEVRTIECRNCGAPVSGTLDGAKVTCQYCSAVLFVTPRAKEQRQGPALDEPARLAGLRAQLDVDNPKNPLRLATPEGLEHLDEMFNEPAARPAALAAYRQEWEQIRKRTAGSESASMELTTRLFQVATRLATLYGQQGDHPRARAVLETALDLLPSLDQRDIIRCHLARAAIRLEDVGAFSAWMKDSNARSVRLEVDTDYRCSMALYHLQQGDFSAVVALLGRDGSELPLLPLELVFCLRAHGLAGLGQHEGAKQQIWLAARRFGVGRVCQVWQGTPGPSSAYADETARRAVDLGRAVRDRGRDHPGPAAGRPDSSLPPGRIRPVRPWRTVLVVLVLALLPLVLGFNLPLCALLAGSGAPFEEAVRLMKQCPVARMGLGREITWAVGCSTGGCQSGSFGSSAGWSMSVKGSRGRGKLMLAATETDGRWTLRAATLRLPSGRHLNLMSCTMRPEAGPSR